jgi:hypothetical protein
MERLFIYFLVATFALLALAIVGNMLYLAVRQGLRAYLRFRGTRVVVCPETRKPVAVEVDARHAAATAVEGQPELRLKSCTRWPVRADCDQDCAWQIERAPADCLVRTIVESWYEGKACVFCHKSIGAVNWHEHQPALLSPEHFTVKWDEIAPEQLPEVFKTHQPVCWNCHIAESFRIEHPDLVVERPWVH